MKNVLKSGESLIHSFHTFSPHPAENLSEDRKGRKSQPVERRRIKHSVEEKLCKSAINKLRREANKFVVFFPALCAEEGLAKLRFSPAEE